MPMLSVSPVTGSAQWQFERYMVGYMYINSGAFAIMNPTTQVASYVNPHAQWMWEQFIKGISA